MDDATTPLVYAGKKPFSLNPIGRYLSLQDFETKIMYPSLSNPTGLIRGSLLFMVILLCYRIEGANSFVPKTSWGISRDQTFYHTPTPPPTRYPIDLHQSQKDKEDNTSIEDDPEDDPVHAFIAEQEAGRKVAQRLMFPRVLATSIGQAITALGWGFLIASFILQTLGYAFVSDNHGGFRIDTLEKLQFQEEIQRSMKDSMRQ
jgi:hypothetical protein